MESESPDKVNAVHSSLPSVSGPNSFLTSVIIWDLVIGLFSADYINRFLWCLLWSGSENTTDFWLLQPCSFCKESSDRGSQGFQILLSVGIHSTWLETSSVAHCSISALWYVYLGSSPIPGHGAIFGNTTGTDASSCDFIVLSTFVASKSLIFSLKSHLKSTLDFLSYFSLEVLLFPWTQYIENRDFFILLTCLFQWEASQWSVRTREHCKALCFPEIQMCTHFCLWWCFITDLPKDRKEEAGFGSASFSLKDLLFIFFKTHTLPGGRGLLDMTEHERAERRSCLRRG